MSLVENPQARVAMRPLSSIVNNINYVKEKLFTFKRNTQCVFCALMLLLRNEDIRMAGELGKKLLPEGSNTLSSF